MRYIYFGEIFIEILITEFKLFVSLSMPVHTFYEYKKRFYRAMSTMTLASVQHVSPSREVMCVGV